ncbi:multiubiquitin domain-containing protein [Sorangium sp. So ce363]|uniref:multiubiquitin domain-containing protein n=1 Tax=Sorangium sp. So ce363 TaxID=3133304 RepID=UPI003F5E5547
MSESGNHANQGQGHEASFNIIVNGRSRVVTGKELTFGQVVALDPDLPKGANVIYTVTYKRGQGNKPEGTLTDGESVKLKEGMIFNVTATDKS